MGKVGKITVGTVGIVLAAIAAAMVWQHLHYQDVRRNALHDVQEVFYSGDVLHAATFLKVAPGDDLFVAMRAMRAATDAFPGAKTVYAGKAAMNAISSAQLTAAFGEEVAWDALALLQFDDAATYHAWRENERVRAALARFATTYAHGMKRPPTINLMLHQVFLAWRFVQAVTFQPHVLPFEPAAVNPVARLGWARRTGCSRSVNSVGTPFSWRTSQRTARPTRWPRTRTTDWPCCRSWPGADTGPCTSARG